MRGLSTSLLARSVACFMTFFAVAAEAAPVNVSSLRLVQIGDNISGSLYGASSPFFVNGSYSDSVTQILGSPGDQQSVLANQTSSVGTSGHFSGTGSAQVGFSALLSDEVFALSLISISFDLLTPHDYTLSGLVDANLDGSLGIAYASLSGAPGFPFIVTDFGSLSLGSSGTLGPGAYAFTVLAEINNGGVTTPGGYVGGSTFYTFDFLLTEASTAVAGPGTLVAVALGLFALPMLRRRDARTARRRSRA